MAERMPVLRRARLVGGREVSVVAGWLAAAGFKGLKNWIWLAIISGVIAAIWAFVAVADRRHENTLDVARDAGATAAVAAGQQQTLDQLGDANNAAQELRDLGERSARRYADCLLDSRDKAACERYNPDPQP